VYRLNIYSCTMEDGQNAIVRKSLRAMIHEAVANENYDNVIEKIKHLKRTTLNNYLKNNSMSNEIIKIKDTRINDILGDHYFWMKDYNNAIKYYKISADNGNIRAILLVASLFEKQGNYPNAQQYYLMAFEKDNLNSKVMRNIGSYYGRRRDYKNELTYKLMAFEHALTPPDIKHSLISLIIHYKKHYLYDEMIKYCLKGIEHNITFAFISLGNYYNSIKDYNNMEKYYLIAIEKKKFECLYIVHRLINYYKKNELHDKLENLYYQLITVEICL